MKSVWIVFAKATVFTTLALLLVLGTSNAWAKGTAKTSGDKAAPAKAKASGEKAAPAKAKASGEKAAPAKAKASGEKAAPAKAKPKAKELDKDGMSEADAKVWALRDHYTFGADSGQVNYAVQNAEWTLDMPGIGNVTDNVGFRITFADGTNWDETMLGKAESVRESFSDELGNGTNFTSQFPAKDGIVVRHSMSIYKDRPFILIRLAVGNVGDKPIEISKLYPVVLGPAGLGKLSADTQVAPRRIRNRGGHIVFDKAAPALLTIFNDVAHKTCLSFGVLPGGIAMSSADLARGSDCWQGDVVCSYLPSIRVNPGEKLPSDPAWLTFRSPQPAEIDQNYAWAVSRIPHVEMSKDLPQYWVAIDKGEPESKLIQAVKEWNGAGVKCALVPENWEGRPGSMEGCTPAYPKDMAKTAKQLAGLGMEPGLTIDPLLVTGGSDDWAMTAADGARWVNAANPDGRKWAVDHAKKAVAWGYRFFVVPPSNIPDEALKRFNMTRVQADVLAMQVMQEAAEGRPVAAGPACSLDAEANAWQEAAAATGRMAEFGISPGAVRLAMKEGAAFDATMLAALALSCAPIECSGKPSADAAKAVSQLCSHGRLFARPIDMARPDPKLWLAAIASIQENVASLSLTAFPGASGWTIADLALDNAADMIVWHAGDGHAIDSSKAVSNGNELAVYGISAKPAHPVLLGASDGPRMMFDDLKYVTWKDDKGVLTALFQGGNRAKATAYVEVPEGWHLKSGKVGDTPVNKKEAGSRLALPIEPGRQTRLELEFVKP